MSRNSSCPPAYLTGSAPSFSATSRCLWLRDMAITWQPSIPANCTAMCPTPPIPNMPIRSPSAGSAAFTALYAVMPAQKSGAAYSGLIELGIGVA
jgi:hypothetical protein